MIVYGKVRFIFWFLKEKNLPYFTGNNKRHIFSIYFLKFLCISFLWLQLMSEAVYNSKKCGIFCHTMRHFYASKMNLIKGSQYWFKVLICDTQHDFANNNYFTSYKPSFSWCEIIGISLVYIDIIRICRYRCSMRI